MSFTTPTRRIVGAGAALLFLGVGGLAACSTSGSDGAGPTTTVAVGGATTTAPDGEPTTTTLDDGGSTTTTEEPTTSTTEVRTTTTRDVRPPTGDDAAYVAGMRDYLADDGDLFDDDEIDCMAVGLVDAVGADRFRAAGVSPDDLDEPFEALGLDDATANEMYEIVDDCSGGMREAMVRSLVEGPGASGGAEAKACIDRTLTEDLVREVFITLFRGEEPPDELRSALASCR